MIEGLLSQGHATDVIITILEHLRDWPIRSAEAFRNAAMGAGVFAINPLLNIRRDAEVMFLKNFIRNTIVEGRMIDFGFIPNDVIKTESIRSREMFEAGEFQHPYETWFATTAWEGGFNGYHISPHPHYPGETLVIELYGVTMPGVCDAILVYDMVSINVKGVGNTQLSPAKMNTNVLETKQELMNRGSNSLDPLVTMLRLLADASIPITTKEVPAKLNKSRVKQGKGPLPNHTLVHTKDYVANFMTARAKAPHKGGTHSSPTAHWRRAHKRVLASGLVVPVRSTKVNWRDTEELHRLFYHIDPK